MDNIDQVSYNISSFSYTYFNVLNSDTISLENKLKVFLYTILVIIGLKNL